MAWMNHTYTPIKRLLPVFTLRQFIGCENVYLPDKRFSSSRI